MSEGRWVTLQGLAAFRHSNIAKIPEGTVCKSMGNIVYMAIDRNWIFKHSSGLTPAEKQILRLLEVETASLIRPDVSTDYPFPSISKYKIHIVGGRIEEYIVEKREPEPEKSKEITAAYLATLNKLPNYGIF